MHMCRWGAWGSYRMNKMWEENKLKIFSVCIFYKKRYFPEVSRTKAFRERVVASWRVRKIQNTTCKSSRGALRLLRTEHYWSFMFPTSKLLLNFLSPFLFLLPQNYFYVKVMSLVAFRFRDFHLLFLYSNVFCGIFPCGSEFRFLAVDRKRRALLSARAVKIKIVGLYTDWR